MRWLLLTAVLLLPLSLFGQSQCGNTTTGGSDFNNQNNVVKTMAKCVPSGPLAVTDCQVYIGSNASGNAACAIYDSDATSPASGDAKTLLCSGPSTALTTTNAFNTLSISGCPVLATGHTYWIAVNFDNTNTLVRYLNFTDNGPIASSTCCSSFPAPISVTANSAALDLYLDTTPATFSATCGNTTTAGSDFSSQAGAIKPFAICTTAVASTVNDCKFYVATAAGNAACAIYKDDGTSPFPGAPFTKVCDGPTTALSGSGFLTLPLSGVCSLSAGSRYWVTVNLDSNSAFIRYLNFTSNGPFQTAACCTFPSTLTSLSSNQAALDLYLDLSATPTLFPPIKASSGFLMPALGMGNIGPQLVWAPSRAMSPTITATAIENNIDALNSNGIAAAWEAFQTPYVSPDYNWATGRSGGSLTVNATAYPSGVAPVVAYAHAHGFKFMIYLSPGSSGCASFPSSVGHYQADANQIAGYGVDGIRGDTCTTFSSNADAQTAYASMSIAKQQTTSSMWFDCSVDPQGLSGTLYGSPVWASGAGCTDVWTSYDHGAMSFSILQTEIDNQYSNSWAGLNKAGRWGEIDFLGIGDDSTLTTTEMTSNISLFALLKSPLVAACDFVAGVNCTNSTIISMLSNAEILAVNQDGLKLGATRVSQTSCGSSTCDVYAVPLNGEGNATYGLVLWNRSSTTQNITITFSGLPGSPGSSYYVRDLIAHSNLLGSPASTSYTFNSIPSHGVATLALCVTQCSTL